MHATIGASIRLTGVLAACLLATPTVAVTQQPGRRQPPPPADVDARLTEAMRGSEQRFADAILHNDSAGLERILAPAGQAGFEFVGETDLSWSEKFGF